MLGGVSERWILPSHLMSDKEIDEASVKVFIDDLNEGKISKEEAKQIVHGWIQDCSLAASTSLQLSRERLIQMLSIHHEDSQAEVLSALRSLFDSLTLQQDIQERKGESLLALEPPLYAFIQEKISSPSSDLLLDSLNVYADFLERLCLLAYSEGKMLTLLTDTQKDEMIEHGEALSKQLAAHTYKEMQETLSSIKRSLKQITGNSFSPLTKTQLGAWQSLVDLRPEPLHFGKNLTIRSKLAHFYLTVGKPKEACAHWQKVLSLISVWQKAHLPVSPSLQAGIYWDLYKVHRQLGDTAEAEKMYALFKLAIQEHFDESALEKELQQQGFPSCCDLLVQKVREGKVASGWAIYQARKWIDHLKTPQPNALCKRQSLSYLLSFPGDDIVEVVVSLLQACLNIESWKADSQQKQTSIWIDLETRTSSLIEKALQEKSSQKLKFLLPLYQGVVERIWLLPYLNPHFSLIHEHVNTITQRANQWDKLDKNSLDPAISDMLSTTQSMLLRLETPTPQIQRSIEGLKIACSLPNIPSALIAGSIGEIYQCLKECRRSIYYYEIALALAHQTGFQEVEKAFNMSLGSLYRSLGDYKKANDYNEKALNLTESNEIEEKKSKVLAYSNTGKTHRYLGDHKKAIDYFEKSLALAIEIGDRFNEGIAYGNIGNSYDSLGQHERGIDYHKKDLAIAIDLGDREGESMALNNLGIAYVALGKYQESIDCHAKSLAIAEERGDLNIQLRAHIFIGEACVCLSESVRAIEHYQKALAIATEIGDRSREMRAYKGLGNAYQFQEKYQEAITYYKRALPIAQEVREKGIEGSIYEKLEEIYQKIGDNKEAINYGEKFLFLVREKQDQGEEKRALGNLGSLYLASGNCEKAIDCYETFLSIHQEPQDLDREKEILESLGTIYQALGKNQKVIECYEKFLALDSSKEDQTTEKRVFAILGMAYFHLGKFQKAIEFHEKALAIVKETGNPKEELNFYNQLGNDYQSQGKHRKAISYYEQALTIARELKKQGNKGSIYVNLGNAYLSLSNYPEAIKSCEKALKIAAKTAKKGIQQSAYTTLGNIYQSQGEYKKAKGYYKQGLTILQETRDRNIEKAIQSSLGSVYGSLGKHKKAMEHYNKALILARESEDKVAEGKIFISMGVNHRSVGEYRQAIHLYQEALDIAVKNSYPFLEALAYANLGVTSNAMGEYTRAIDYFKKALPLVIQLEDTKAEGTIYGNIGIAFRGLSLYEEAINYHTKDLAIAEKLADQEGQKRAYGNLGNIFFCLGDNKKSIECLAESLEIARNIGSLSGEGLVYGNLGNAYLELNDHQQAMDYYSKELASAEQTGDNIEKARAFHHLGHMHWLFKEFAQSETYFRKSIEVHLHIQQELKESSQWQIALFQEQSKTYKLFESILTSQGKQEQALEIADFSRYRALISALSNSLLSQGVELESNQLLTPVQMQQLANQHQTTFILYSLAPLIISEKHVNVWVISSQKIDYLSLPIDSIQNEIEKISAVLQEFPFSRIQGNTDLTSIPITSDMEQLRGKIKTTERWRNDPDDEAAFAFSREELKQKLTKWYEVFIVPLKPYLPRDNQQTLTIVPDGILSQIPFGCFFNKKENQYLIEEYPIRIAPSLHILNLLSKREAANSPIQTLVAGNPDTGNPGDHLPFSEKEVEALKQVFPRNETHVLRGNQATVQRIKEEMQQAKWVFLSCHGLAGQKPDNDPHSVFEGCLKLAPDEKHLNGHLYAKDIAMLNLQVEVAFLSACYSGTGNVQHEGSIGNVWAFLAAGVQSVVATYWPLDDSELTVEMVRKFAEHLLEREKTQLNHAQALQKIIKEAIKKHPDEPDHWGAFFLTGM